MFRFLKFVGKVSFSVKPLPNIRPRECKILVRSYTSKKDSSDCDTKRPTGTTKTITECLPGATKASSSSLKSEIKKGHTIAPTECRQTAKKDDVPIYGNDCKTPHVDTCSKQLPVNAQSGCKPGGSNFSSRMQDCGKHSMMDDCPKPGSWGKDYEKKQRTLNLILLLGGLLAAGTLYYLWSKNYFSTEVKEKGKDEKKKTEKKPKKKDRWPVMPAKVPANSNDIPNSVPYLLIGGGTASFAAFRAIKSCDPTAQVLVVGEEPFLPYMRPPLSKELFFSVGKSKIEEFMFQQWNGVERSLFYEPQEFYTDCKNLLTSKNGGVAVARGWKVVELNVNKRTAILEDGKEIQYDKCLIATGSIPKNLPIFENANKEIKKKVSLYRDIYNFEQLEDIISDGAKSIAIIGGGFLGSELACALARRGKKQGVKIYQVFKENGNMAKILPEYLCKWTTEQVKNEGVEIFPNTEVDEVKLVNNEISLTLANGKNITADHVIVSIGSEPNTKLAEGPDASLEIDPDLGGYLVNAELEARSNLYIAGDCACFYDVKLGRRRVEHHDHAVVSGRLAGENMTGAAKPYLHQPMFWSDLGQDVGYEAIGIIDSSLNTVGVYAKLSKDSVKKETPENVTSDTKTSDLNREDFNKGVIFYLDQGIIVGIVLWNVYNRIHIARQVLKESKKYEDLNEVAKLFNIHDE